ncbi:hypothetical protein GCM10007291_13660 [Gemmobacter nanjingensis]|uniref:Cadherin domain-containing protein n=1 Tax=Gemmobacter nanjingensis TaxID=488454 RepID=A0ABQ3FAX3_9RHOB|nr:Hint domain-containing protein [Gemmobacter nanjingensis]GHC16447.1 hypothetical protein GCM10007291_13660 [Gemmobacter nanjingensis]
MPVFALYNFEDTDTHARDSALDNGAQDGIYLNGAASDGTRAVLDGDNDLVKIYPNPAFQLDRGTLEIQFSSSENPVSGTQTILSRDSVGETPGGYRVELLDDGSIVITHETDTSSTVFTTGPGFSAPGDEIKLTYSWDAANGGHLDLENFTQGTSFDDAVPPGLTMDQSSEGIDQPWMIGAGQAHSNPNMLNNIDQHFAGSVEYFSISDTVDNQSQDPVANPDTAETDEDVPVDIDVLTNDTDPQGQTLTVTTGSATNGTVTVNPDGTLHYVPNADFNGTDTITYEIRDPDGNTATSTVTVTVNPVNDAPDAVNDHANTDAGTPVVIAVLANDTDVDNDPLSVVSAGTSPDGTVTVNADGTITFTPNAGFSGDATFEYTITDPDGLTDTATVTVTVAPPPRDGWVDGTAGNDLIDTSYTGDPDGDRIDANDAIIPGDDPNDDRVRAGEGDDTVYSGLGDDTVFAGAGNDLVYGGPGDDSIVGWDGDDTIYGGNGRDIVRGGQGNDLIDTSATGIPRPDMGYPGLYPDDANPFNDMDTVYGGDGDDTIRTGDDADLIYGGDENDLIDGGIDADTIYGGRDDDTVIGGEGADLIHLGHGDDLAYGGLDPSYPDELNIPDATDLRPDNGMDTIYGGLGNDTIFGMDDNDVLYGGVGNDMLDGGIDQDTIYGDEGNDTILGGEGADSLSGGDDRDTFVIGSANDGIGDVIDGGEGGDDYDTLDLRSAGPLVVHYAADNPENGTVDFLDADGNVTGTMTFTNIENVIPCFTPGTLIATPRGEVPVEELKAGDRVITRDNGIQQIRWVGQKALNWTDLSLNPHLKPILIRKGSLGNGLPERDMMVSPNHRVLVANDRTALYFDEHEVLVAAKHLVAGRGVHEVDSMGTTYIHFMFDRHEVVLSNGAWTESFQPGDYTLNGMGNAQRNEIYELFPELKSDVGREAYGAARRTLKKHEARLLVK